MMKKTHYPANPKTLTPTSERSTVGIWHVHLTWIPQNSLSDSRLLTADSR
ncbi:MAG: hypothetical protein OXH00_16480 [Candidatus Poribacteria bacterium]|nr:hypothetical protein [Candidatus Poribacteria bacterium]